MFKWKNEKEKYEFKIWEYTSVNNPCPLNKEIEVKHIGIVLREVKLSDKKYNEF